MKSTLNSCQSRSKLAKITEPDWFVFVRDGSPGSVNQIIIIEVRKVMDRTTVGAEHLFFEPVQQRAALAS